MAEDFFFRLSINGYKWGGTMGYPNSWMVYNVKSQTKIDDLGVPLFQETSIWLEESLGSCHLRNTQQHGGDLKLI